jgi:hypothetical protein
MHGKKAFAQCVFLLECCVSCFIWQSLCSRAVHLRFTRQIRLALRSDAGSWQLEAVLCVCRQSRSHPAQPPCSPAPVPACLDGSPALLSPRAVFACAYGHRARSCMVVHHRCVPSAPACRIHGWGMRRAVQARWTRGTRSGSLKAGGLPIARVWSGRCR